MIDDVKFKIIKEKILSLCKKNSVPLPIISKAEETDYCDVTDPPYIRILPISGVDVDYHAKHILGHYIADLHLITADYVADLIGNLLEGEDDD